MRLSGRTLAVAITIVLLSTHDLQADRRRSVRSPEPPFNAAYTEGGYADRTSVEQGGTIDLHIATGVSPFTARVVNLAEPTVPLQFVSGLQSSPKNCSGQFLQGCEWAVTTTLAIPSFWPSGYYAVAFPTSAGEKFIPFVVRARIRGARTRILVVSPTHTWQAYNSFGGASFFPDDDPRRATLLTYDRPYLEGNGLGRYASFEKNLVDWMKDENILFDVITDVDLEDPTMLSAYRVVVLPGQSTYWTASARENLEAFNRVGGHIAVLSGSTMWWQVRLEENNRVIVAYKGERDTRVDPGSPFTSTHFFSAPVNNAENRLLGTSFRYGGYANRLNDQTTELKPLEERTPWTAVDASSWVFAGTGLQNGQPFGRETTGLEVDGVVFNCDASGRVTGPEGSDEAPLNYEILAITPASEGWGTMGLLVNQSGGAIFNAATTGWVWGLFTNETVETITRNVLTRFATGLPLPYHNADSNVLVQDLFNCSAAMGATGWESSQPRPQTSSACAYEGSAGLDLSGPAKIAMARSLTARSAARDNSDVSFYVKADEMQRRTEFPATLLALEEKTSTATRAGISVELDASNGKQLRIARRDSAGVFTASPWITLSNGWHRVDLMWRGGGTSSLSVDGGAAVTLDTTADAPKVNRVVVAYPTPERTDAGRVCVDSLSVTGR